MSQPTWTSFPRTAADMSADWLTEALRRDGVLDDSGHVTGFRAVELGAGFGQTSDATRVMLELARPSEDTPRSVIAKFATADVARRTASLSAHLYENEIRFYRDIADRVDTCAPHCYLADMTDDGEFFALLLEDFADHRPGDETVGASVAEAQLAVSQLAALHGPFWGRSSESGAQPWTMLPYDRVVNAWPIMVDTFGEYLPKTVLDMKDEFLESLPALHEWMGSEPTTLAHGDFRLDNLLFDETPASNRPIVVLDWQAVHVGRGIRDFAYLVAHSMPTTERRTGQEALLRSYLAELATYGVEYSFDDAWHDYRLAMLYLFSIVLWITGVNVNAHERALRRKRALVERAATALLDVDALDLLPFN